MDISPFGWICWIEVQFGFKDQTQPLDCLLEKARKGNESDERSKHAKVNREFVAQICAQVYRRMNWRQDFFQNPFAMLAKGNEKQR